MDAVAIGSIASVLGALVVIGYLTIKVARLIRRDAERHDKP